MAHFFRGRLCLSPVILFIVFLLPFCQSRSSVTLEKRNETVTMADVDFSCPAGGKWFACPSSSNSKFVGCCATDGDPCSTGCAAGNLQTVNYNGSYYGKFPDATCGPTSRFFTCGVDPSGKNTFWGCCKTNPCANNPICPVGSLTNAYMELPEQFAFYASSTLPTSVSSTSSATASTTSGSSGGSSSNGAVIGGAVGGAVGAVLIVGFIVLFLLRRRRNAKTARGENVQVSSHNMNDPKAFNPHTPNLASQSPPPTYSATSGGYYQSMTPQGKTDPYNQSPYPQGQWAHTADGPQEMEADVGPSNRYSELPAEVSRPGKHHRYSELSTGPSCRVSPHHSPKASQNENTIESRVQGLGLVTESSTKPS